jgi:hypothetical protein
MGDFIRGNRQLLFDGLEHGKQDTGESGENQTAN